MNKKESSVARELGKFIQAFWQELPMAVANRILGNGDETALQQAGWKAYDAFVSLANETTNQIYANPVVGSLTGQAMERTMRVQHVASAATAGFFGNLWPALGLPTSNEIAALRTEVVKLRAELGAAVETAGDEPQTPASFTNGLKLVRNDALKRYGSDEDAAA